MQIINKITSILLVITFLCCCFPVYQSEDINKDLKIDLHDAITVVKNVADNAEQKSGSFKENIKRAVSTLTAAVGLKKVLKTNHSVSNMGYSLMDNPFLVLKNISVVMTETSWFIQPIDSLFKSHVVPPDIKPPRLQSFLLS
jgi:hypothetical protein